MEVRTWHPGDHSMAVAIRFAMTIEAPPLAVTRSSTRWCTGSKVNCSRRLPFRNFKTASRSMYCLAPTRVAILGGAEIAPPVHQAALVVQTRWSR